MPNTADLVAPPQFHRTATRSQAASQRTAKSLITTTWLGVVAELSVPASRTSCRKPLSRDSERGRKWGGPESQRIESNEARSE
jgi:hypothetical protein